jgi:hypothetical protein
MIRLKANNLVKSIRYLGILGILSFGWGDIIITEIADPNDNSSARYIEIHNSGASSVTLTNYYIIRWTNTNAGATANINLSSYSLAAGEFLIFAVNNTTLNSTFSAGATTVVDVSAGGPADSNGDDNHAIVTEAAGQTFSHTDANTYDIVDMFGVVGEDGSGKWHEFEDGRAERVSTATSASGATASSSDWNCFSDSETWLAGVDQNAGNSLVATTTAFTDNGFDPGSWDGYRSVTISGNSGFRMMSSPVAGQIYSDLLSELWTQGMTSADVTSGDANVWTYDGSSWSALSDITGSGGGSSLTAGQGFLVYVFADTDNDGTDDLPATLSVSGTENSSSATVPSSGSIADAAWELAGNPYAQTIDWDDVTQAAVTTSCYVWDDATSAYITWNGSAGSLTDGLIAPYQGFWVKGSGGSGSLTIATADKSNSSGSFYRTAQTYSATFTATSATKTQTFYLSFNEGGDVGMDNYDAHKLMPLDMTPRLVGMTFADDGSALAVNNLPLDLTGTTVIDMDILSLNVLGDIFETEVEEVTLTWDLSNVPTGLSFTVTNTETQETVHLADSDEYSFLTQEKGSVVYGSSGVNSYPMVGSPVLSLSINTLTQSVDTGVVPTAFELHPVYPNPFNPSAAIRFDVPAVEDAIMHSLQMRVFNINGQLVETLINEQMQPGTHKIKWNPVNISSGIYMVQMKAGEKTFNQKITFIK